MRTSLEKFQQKPDIMYVLCSGLLDLLDRASMIMTPLQKRKSLRLLNSAKKSGALWSCGENVECTCKAEATNGLEKELYVKLGE